MRWLVLVLLPICAGCVWLPEGRTVDLVSYNVQNVFDDKSDGTEYDEFDPANGEWSAADYHTRISRLAQVLEAVSGGGPDIVLLQEVESRAVLEELASVWLSGCGYRYVYCPSAPGSAVNTGILSRFPLENTRAHSVALEDFGPSRYILEVDVIIGDVTLSLFNNHWKSRLGGVEATESARIASAQLVRSLVDEKLLRFPDAEIIVAGDLNESYRTEWEVLSPGTAALAWFDARIVRRQPPDETQLYAFPGLWITLDADCLRRNGAPILFSPWKAADPQGSFHYNGTWETFDHFLLSPGLLDEDGLCFTDFEVIREPMLLTGDGFPKSFRADLGSGYSDHLPIRLTVQKN